jgi:hypothetical protein
MANLPCIFNTSGHEIPLQFITFYHKFLPYAFIECSTCVLIDHKFSPCVFIDYPTYVLINHNFLPNAFSLTAPPAFIQPWIFTSNLINGYDSENFNDNEQRFGNGSEFKGI